MKLCVSQMMQNLADRPGIWRRSTIKQLTIVDARVLKHRYELIESIRVGRQRCDPAIIGKDRHRDLRVLLDLRDLPELLIDCI